ncbi:MAG: four helix bundle protein [Cyanobacteria bacterium NC_groundwater_1444_Ag_S-0.65um_54_12]|nr:four helix bundle protein [Cyanobacteria bacterium NC_groundwater_1444_Ag_S-0.65um_54_12]
MLDAQSLATQAASRLLAKLVKVPAVYRDLADQARRAVASVPLNIAEATGRVGKDRSHHFRIAYGSAQEATVAIQLLASVGVLSGTDEVKFVALLDRVKAMTWRLAGR